ncbi:hypothetical protein ACQB60_40500 [Actinomycetota bacterium Odt1-20B]
MPRAALRASARRSTTRSRTLPEATSHSPALARTALDLYTALHLDRARVRHLTLRAGQLIPSEHTHHQLLLDPADDKVHRLEAVADAARARFGPHIIRPAAIRPPGS